MGVEIRSFSSQKGTKDLKHVGDLLADSLMTEKSFAITFKGQTEEGYTVKLKKSGFLRQFSGLVYTISVSLQIHDNVVIVKVDDGDIRNQIASIGVALFVVWPVLITAGYGWMAKGDIRKEILLKAEELLCDKYNFEKPKIETNSGHITAEEFDKKFLKK